MELTRTDKRTNGTYRRTGKKTIEHAEEQPRRSEEEAKRLIEVAMRNSQDFLNQHNPTLAMIEFECARILRNFLRE